MISTARRGIRIPNPGINEIAEKSFCDRGAISII